MIPNVKDSVIHELEVKAFGIHEALAKAPR